MANGVSNFTRVLSLEIHPSHTWISNSQNL